MKSAIKVSELEDAQLSSPRPRCPIEILKRTFLIGSISAHGSTLMAKARGILPAAAKAAAQHTAAASSALLAAVRRRCCRMAAACVLALLLRLFCSLLLNWLSKEAKYQELCLRLLG